MIVEDDLEYLALYEEILGRNFEVYAFTCAEEALDATGKLKPHTIILDLHLPDITGIEFCQELNKQSAKYANFEIIFVSGESDIKQKLKAFEMGAADFIGKPFDINKLKHKVSASIRRQINHQPSREKISNYGSISVEQTSKCNQIMHFYNDISSCATVHSIATVFFSLMSDFELQASICFRLPQPLCLRDDHIRTTPIEEEVFEILKNSGRLYELSNRLLINEEHVSFLIKYTPENSQNFKLIKQSAIDLAEAMNAKAIDLCNEQEKNSPSGNIANKLEELSFDISDYQNDINRLLTIMMYKISERFQCLNMTEEQNQWLEQLTKHTIKEIEDASNKVIHAASSLSVTAQSTDPSEKSTYVQPSSKF
ncbi:response regulator [Pseudoalteromonas sp. SMS1]|uniref:response regulator n=1 Tax=Pseudoalteromonas sp. SMS1 TaxID=2908894 RepID=UPI001F334B58|nr:response regulator [Pseudoalteromonas sp. SMS1]MCF2858696.1 response regulator [Pseudoalteromonas sp. SMS1]